VRVWLEAAKDRLASSTSRLLRMLQKSAIKREWFLWIAVIAFVTSLFGPLSVSVVLGIVAIALFFVTPVE